MFFQAIENLTNVDWLILTTTAFSYLFIGYAIKKKKGSGQSFFAWIMWLILDVILLIPTLKESGKSSLMLFVSILGSFFISILLLKFKKVEWNLGEWISLILIFIVGFIWYFSSNNDTVISCGVACQVIAGISLTIKTWQEPEPEYIPGYLFFILGCIFLLILEKNFLKSFSLQDHLFPLFLGIQTVAEIIALVRKLWQTRLKRK